MKKINKNIFICALLVVMMLVCVNAASASDAVDDALATDDADVELTASGDTIYVDSSSTADEQGTQSNPYKTISAAVGNATGGETIFIKNGAYSESNTITFTKSLSLVGESQDGVKITGAAKSLFSAVEPAMTLSFNNLTILNAGSGSNAAMKFTYSEHNIIITNCVLDNCVSKWGSIQLGAPGTATVTNCKILNSKEATSAGCSALYISGAGVYEIRDVLIDSPLYTLSSSYSYGAIYISNANARVAMVNTTFVNATGQSRGVIFNCGKLNMSRCTIENCKFTKFNTQSCGVITTANNAETKIEQTIIANNTCVDNVFCNVGDNSKLTLNYNNIQDNDASGLVNAVGTFDLENNYWGSNTLPEGVTANVWVVEEQGTYKLSNDSSLAEEIPGLNTESGSGPVLPTAHDTIYVDGVNGLDTNDGLTEATAVKTIEKAVELASDLYYDYDDVDLAFIVIKEGAYVENAITIDETIMFNTTGPVTWDANGKRTLYVKDGACVSLSNITFINGNETYNGAVIHQDYGVVTIDNCVFTNNGGENRQALIQTKYGTLVITNSVFDKNTAHKTSTSYGNIYLANDAKLYVDNCNFTNNYNKYGVFYLSGSQGEISNCLFIGNNATSSSGGSGAGIYVAGTSTTQSVSTGKISNGTASNLVVKNCQFINNTAFGGKYYGGSGGAIYVNNNATVTIVDSLFENNVAVSDGETGKGGAIFASAGDITVNGCEFKNNNAEEGAEVYLKYYDSTSSYSIMLAPKAINKADFKDSIFNNENEAIFVSTDANYTVDANENYWYDNDPSSKVGENVALENWVIMTAKVTPDEAQIGDNITIDVAFDKLKHADDSISEYTGTLPEMDVAFVSTSGKLDETVKTKDGKASVNYTIDAADDGITIGGNEFVPLTAGIIYVSPEGNDTNAGTESAPVKTIAKAIEISIKGKIILLNGTHKTGDLGSISKDLSITSQGEAIIDAQNNNRVLYVGSSANVFIEGITLINGYTSASESGALFGNSGNLTIINCTLANSTSSKNGGAIYNAGNLIVLDSTFENNKASQNGGAIFTQNGGTGKAPTLAITNSAFTKNSAGGSGNFGGGAIFAQQAADGLSIENTNFTSNYVEQSGGGAVEIVNVNVATITGCNFVANSAKGEESDSNYGGAAISFVGAYSDKKETLTVTDTLFEGNYLDGVGGGAIYARASTVNVASSMIIDNTDDFGYAIYARVTSYVTPSVTANDNWWGSSDSPKSAVSNKVTLNRWAVLTVSNDTAFVEGENVTITADINSYTTGTASGKMTNPINVARDVTIETSAGDIEGVLENGEFSTVFNVPAGLKFVDAVLDYQKENLYMVSTETIVAIDNYTAKKAERPTYIINVTCADGTIVNQGTVELFINEESIAVLDVENGTAKGRFVVSLDAGKYDIVAKYVDESGMFVESFGTATLTVSSTRNDYIYNSNFHDYFDEDGYLYDDIPYTRLYFRDDFNAEDLGLKTLVIAAPMSFNIYSSYGTFNNITFRVTSPDVLINRIVLNLDGDHGKAFSIEADDVTVQTVTVNYNTAPDTNAYAFYAYDVDNFRSLSSTINFNSNAIGTPGYTQHAIQLRECTNCEIRKTEINSKLPACDVDYYSGAQGIDADLILAIGVQGGNKIKLNGNTINTEVTGTYGNFSTVDSIMVCDSANLTIIQNTISQVDFSTVGAGYSNVVDLYRCNDAQILKNNIFVNSTAGKDGEGTAYPIQLTGGYQNLLIDANTLTSISCGPTLGIYSQNYADPTDLTVTNNFINVTGLASNSSAWSLVSGMELQDTVAKIYNNTVYSQNIGAYDDSNYVFGISYAQWLYGDHTFDIRDNHVFTEGKYAVYFLNAKDSNVIHNNLHAHELLGDEAAIIMDGEGNVIKKNMPPYGAEIIIDAPMAIKGFEYTITVNIDNATEGNVTINVNGKEYKDLPVVNGTVSQVVDFADLVDGINNVSVVYSGSEAVNPGEANTTFVLADGVITNSTFFNYFDAKGYLLPITKGVTLDFQGPFYGNTYKVFINSPVNIISSVPDSSLLSANDPSTATAVFYTGATGTISSFNIIEGADYTNVTGLTFVNTPILITGPTHVTLDNIYTLANRSGVGSGTGFVCFRSGAEYGTVKNSYLENAGNGGSSVIVAGKGASYMTVDNNTIMVTGNSGNIVSANAYVGSGAMASGLTITNNYIQNNMPAISYCYAIGVAGPGNLIENNTVKHNGSGIVTSYNANTVNNVYRNNNVSGTATFSAPADSIVDNNNVKGTMSVGANSVVTNNVAGVLNINGANVVAENNTVNGAVTLGTSAKNTTFTDNTVNGLLTVKANDNVITGNDITSTSAYAIDLGTTSNNTVTDNKLASANKLGDEAVNYAGGNNNNVTHNGGNPIMTIVANNVFVGNNNTIVISIVNATGNVTVKVNSKEFKELKLTEGAIKIEVNASDIVAGVNNVTVTYNGDEFINVGTETATFRGLDNVVTEDIFYEYFDDYGFLKDEIKFKELIFEGTFNKLSYYVYLDRPIKITGQDALLKDMCIIIDTDNVTIDNVDMAATMEFGSLITVGGSNVTLSNMNISYNVKDVSAEIITIDGQDNVKLLNNNIKLESKISSDSKHALGVNVVDSSNIVIDGNEISAKYPALYVTNWEELGLNNVNAIRVKTVENLTITNNEISAVSNDFSADYPTIQAMLISSVTNGLIDHNNISMIDTLCPEGKPSYLYAMNFAKSEDLTISNNNFVLSSKGGQNAAGTAYALQGTTSKVKIIGNNITSANNGPNLGIYVASWSGEHSTIYAADNFINVTGFANSSDPWAVISGIEIQNGDIQAYNNFIITDNRAGYVDIAPVYGISYTQYMYGSRSFDIQNNTIVTAGKYAVSVLDGTPANVTGNTLYAHELFGDDSVAPGYVGIVENNTPPFDVEIIIDGQAAWVGTNSTITVTVPAGTGNVTIKVGNKTLAKELQLVNSTVTINVTAEDLTVGSNNITVIYNGDEFIYPGEAIGNLEVLAGVITNETFKYYFDKDNGNYLFDYVPENAVLDFQGAFINKDYNVYINKPVTVVSSTNDAVFEYTGNTNNKENCIKFNVVAGGDHTNITDISIINGVLFIQGASYVTVDDIYMKANKSGVGSGTGYLAIHSEAYYTTVKNSHFENGGTGSSCVVLGKGGKYATFDNNVFEITGSSGNVLSSNVFVGAGELPQFVNYTNNVINSKVAASGFMYGITVCGEGNIIENNSLLNFKGNAIINQYGATSTKNIYRNNTITGGGSMQIGTYSLVENNHVTEGALTVTEGCTFVNNSAKSLTISGKNVVAEDNAIVTTVTISAAAKNTTFVNNTVGGLVTVESNENTIVDNIIVVSNNEYAVDLKSTANNTVSDNILYAKEFVGDKAVSFVEDKNNTVENNFPIDPVLVVEASDINVGENATINVSFKENVTGIVEVIVDGKKYLVDVADGKGQLNVSDLVANEYTVGANYGGDLIYIPTTNSTVFTVTKLPVENSTNITIPTGEIKPGDNTTVDVSIPNATGVVSVIVDGKETVVPLVNGTASVPLDNVSGGNHSVVVIYSGDATHAPAHSVSTFSVPEEPIPEKTNVYIELERTAIDSYSIDIYSGEQGKEWFVATLKDASGKVISNATVQVTFDGQVHNLTTDADGKVKLQINVRAFGAYTATFVFLGDETHNANMTFGTANIIQKLTTITAPAKAYKASVKVKKYTIAIKTKPYSSADGKAHIGAGLKVVMKINGKVYSGVTNAKGQVTFKITNLNKKGKYVALLRSYSNKCYKGASIKTTIIVK